MLEKKKRFDGKKKIMLFLCLCMINGIVAFATTKSGKYYGIQYTFVGNVSQNGIYLKTTGSTQANIGLQKKTNYISVEADQEYVNKNGTKAVSTVKSYKKEAKNITSDIIQAKMVSLGTVNIPKTKNGKPVIARVGHSFSSDGVSSCAYTVH